MRMVFVFGKSCGTCHRIESMVKRVCDKKNVIFEARDVDEMAKRAIEEYGIKSLPTMILFDDSNVALDSKSGSITSDELGSWFDEWR